MCQNEKCLYYLTENGKDIIKSGVYRSGHQRYFCKHCHTYFMETKGTPLYRKHLPESEIKLICKLLVEKTGIRSIERITGHHRDTIGGLLDDLASHAEKRTDFLISELKLAPIECDEFRSFIKKQKKVKPGSSNRAEEGDAWIYTGIKRESYMFVAFSVGKWTKEVCREPMDRIYYRMQLPTPDNRFVIYTDGNNDYKSLLPEYYAEPCMVYGQLVKHRKNGRLVWKEKRIVYGTADAADIETVNVENHNPNLRIFY